MVMCRNKYLNSLDSNHIERINDVHPTKIDLKRYLKFSRFLLPSYLYSEIGETYEIVNFSVLEDIDG